MCASKVTIVVFSLATALVSLLFAASTQGGF